MDLRRIPSLLIAVVMCCASIAALYAGEAPQGLDIPAGKTQLKLKAQNADLLVNSIGVNVRLSRPDTTYGQFNEIVKPKLAELGVRYIRDVAAPGRPEIVERFNVLARELGIRSTLRVRLEDLPDVLPQLKDSLSAVEGRALPDRVAAWEHLVVGEQKALFQTLKENPDTKSLHVLGSALSKVRDSYGKLAAVGKLEDVLDFGNFQNLPPGTPPSQLAPDFTVDQLLEEVKKVSGARPAVCTEFGYHNITRHEQRPGVTDRLAAKYISRGLFYNFSRGVWRTFIHELLDPAIDATGQNVDQHYGMLLHNGGPKLAFSAVKNTIKLLSDPGPAFDTYEVEMVFRGEMRDIQTLLLQKRDGKLILALWQEVPSYDLFHRTELEVPDRLMFLTIQAPVAKVEMFQPMRSDERVAAFEGTNEFFINIPDEVMLLVLTLK